MDCTATTGPLRLEGEDHQASYRDPTGLSREDPPIYAALVTQWRTAGRTIPGARDAQWAILTCATAETTGRHRRSAAPPRQENWERVSPPVARRADLAPAR
ncbi:hypothetical protein ACFY3G_53340 [Streptomyces phaeochromogenes]|uniref:hypothetical protein n=1 Tax=Streptomyces phaeochromogenes TaxID=1923 RepID=UPI00368F0FE6